MLIIIPSILTDDPGELRKLMGRCEGVVDRVHIDIIDGVFAENKTIMPEVVAELDTRLFLDYHLMVKEPINWIEKSIRGFADRIIGQIEMMESQERFVDDIVSKSYKAGLALDLDTPVSDLDQDVLKEVDAVLIMSVAAGFGGQEFSNEAIKKIKRLSDFREENGYNYKICVDGGVHFENIDDSHYLGADEVSIGRKLFDGDLKTNLEKFQRSAHDVKLME